MDDVLELSSDSDDTIIYTPQTSFSLKPESDDVASIVTKYITENCLQENPDSLGKLPVENNDVEENLGVPCVKKRKCDNPEPLSDGLSQEESFDDDVLLMLHEKYKKTTKNEFDEKEVAPSENNIQTVGDKELKKREKELQKQRKLEEREQKKKQAEQEKNLKKALSSANKNIKPIECMKFITVRIDNDIINDEYGSEILNALRGIEVQYSVAPQVFPLTITWSRKVQSHSMDEAGKLVSSSEDQSEDHVLLIMKCKEFVEHISNKSLCTCITSMKSVLINKKITLAVYGLQSYKRHLKNEKQREIRSEIANDNAKRGTKNFFKDFPKVTKKMIEYGLTEMQLLHSCSHRLVESAADLGLLVAQFTKAVAEIPFKLQRHEKFQQTEWFATGDNRDCVKVDKEGNGLSRLWNQTLTTFPLARLETAEAISSQYRTVSALMKAYETCRINEGESLLQDIPVRRAAGPLSSSRKIGPELSKKIHNFYTATDGDTLL